MFRATAAAEMESPFALHNRAQIAFAAAPSAHGCIPRWHRRVPVIDRHNEVFGQAFGRFFSRARFGNSAGHCTI